MKKHLIKPLLASLLLVGAVSAQAAAHLEVTSYTTPTIAYQGVVGSTFFFNNGTDNSSGMDALAFYGNYDVAGNSNYGYLADAYLTEGNKLSMSSMQYFASNAQTIYFGSAINSTMDINLMVVADDTDSSSTFNVTFSGLAASFQSASSGTSAISMTVSNGSSILGSFFSASTTLNDAPISFNFQAQEGDILTLSASVSNNLVANAPTNVVQIGGLLSGEFTVVAVPEPEQYALLLAGLGLIGGIARRRNH